MRLTITLHGGDPEDVLVERGVEFASAATGTTVRVAIGRSAELFLDELITEALLGLEPRDTNAD